jgi:hypothetical protein
VSLEELTRVVSPPPDPVETGDAETLSRIEQRLRITLPNDYIELARKYGTGGFLGGGFGFLRVLNPFAAYYFEKVQEIGEVWRGIKADREDSVPYKIFPEVGGLLPWADDADGSMLFWLTNGDPEYWPILAVAPRSDYYQRFDMSITTFLAGCFAGTISCYCWSSRARSASSAPLRFRKGL